MSGHNKKTSSNDIKENRKVDQKIHDVASGDLASVKENQNKSHTNKKNKELLDNLSDENKLPVTQISTWNKSINKGECDFYHTITLGAIDQAISDVSKYKKKGSKMKNELLIAEIDNYIKNFNKYPFVFNYHYIMTYIEMIGGPRLDVSKYKKQLSKMRKKLLITEIENSMVKFKQNPVIFWYHTIIKAISNAEAVGLDVSKYKKTIIGNEKGVTNCGNKK